MEKVTGQMVNGLKGNAVSLSTSTHLTTKRTEEYTENRVQNQVHKTKSSFSSI